MSLAIRSRVSVKPLLLALVGAGMLTGLVAGYLYGEGVIERRYVWAGLAIATAVSSPVGWIIWFRMDEAVREAHKSAWMHGGSVGTLVAMVGLSLLLAFAPNAAAWLGLGALPPMELVGVGLLGLFLVQTTGYGLFWAGWWLSKR